MGKGGLVLSRFVDEEIHIGKPGEPDVTVKVVGVKGNNVRLQVKAAPNVEIHRKEVAEDIVRRLNTEGAGDE